MEILLISEIHYYLQGVCWWKIYEMQGFGGILGYVAEAGVVAQLSIQAIEDPNTPVEIYTNTDGRR